LPDGLEEQSAHPQLEQTDGPCGKAGQKEADAQPATTRRLTVQTTIFGLPRSSAGMELDDGSQQQAEAGDYGNPRSSAPYQQNCLARNQDFWCRGEVGGRKSTVSFL